MNKKYLAVFLVFMVLTAGFTACKKADKSGIVIIDNRGTERVLATDSNGETMTDAAGNMIVVVTQADGNAVTVEGGGQETQTVSPPPYYVYNNIIECPKFSVQIPQGWEQGSASDIMLRHIETNCELKLMVKDGKSFDEVLTSARDLLQMAKDKDPDAKLDVSAVSICGVEATMLNYITLEKTGVFYVFNKNSTTFLFSAIVNNEYKDSIDFNAVINTVNFK